LAFLRGSNPQNDDKKSRLGRMAKTGKRSRLPVRSQLATFGRVEICAWNYARVKSSAIGRDVTRYGGWSVTVRNGLG
jgi:hypothetical protein